MELVLTTLYNLQLSWSSCLQPRDRVPLQGHQINRSHREIINGRGRKKKQSPDTQIYILFFLGHFVFCEIVDNFTSLGL